MISLKGIRITPLPGNLRSFLPDVNKSAEQPAETAATQRVLAEKSASGLVLGWKRGISSPVLHRVVWNDVGIQGKPDQSIHSRLKTGSHSKQATCQGFTTHLWASTPTEMDVSAKKISTPQAPHLFCTGLGKDHFNNKRKISEKQNPSCAQLGSSLHPQGFAARTWVNKGNVTRHPHGNRLGSAATLTMSDS